MKTKRLYKWQLPPHHICTNKCCKEYQGDGVWTCNKIKVIPIKSEAMRNNKN